MPFFFIRIFELANEGRGRSREKKKVRREKDSTFSMLIWRMECSVCYDSYGGCHGRKECARR
jgi:hypothetical protein